MTFGDFFSYLFLTVCSLGIVWCFWSLYCNQVTYKQRTMLLESFRYLSGDQFYDKYTAYNSVTYDEHMWLLQTFRDPCTLYPASMNWN